MAEVAHKFNENNVYRVRRDSQFAKSLFLCKLVIKKHGSVQIEAIGECISLVAKLAQLLVKDELAVYQKIFSENIDREGRKELHPKLTILLNKSDKFDALTESLILKPKPEQK